VRTSRTAVGANHRSTDKRARNLVSGVPAKSYGVLPIEMTGAVADFVDFELYLLKLHVSPRFTNEEPRMHHARYAAKNTNSVVL
jgi:hypothetical protein